MLRSMEYPTASEQPCFTVRYGYSLPTGLAAGVVYSFIHISSNKYLNVSGLPDADNTNVIQYTGNNTASRQFRLQFTYYDFFAPEADDLILEKSNGYVSLRPGTIPAFRQFYILRHRNSLMLNSTYPNHPKPFLSAITFTVEFSGVIS